MAELLDNLSHLPGGFGVEARCGLVEEEQRRFVEQGASQSEPLLHALAEPANSIVGPSCKFKEIQQFVNAAG